MRALALLAVVLAGQAWAHKASDSYLTLTPRGSEVSARWDIALRDFDGELDLDANGDGMILWSEVVAKQPALLSYAMGHLQLAQAGNNCAPSPAALRLTQHSDGVYAVLDFSFACPAVVTDVTLTYSLLFDVDAQHRGLVRRADAGDSWVAFSGDERSRVLTFAAVSRAQQIWQALKGAVGAELLCLLLALLLPSVLRRRAGAWDAAEQLRPALLEALKVVAAFSLALGAAARANVHPEPKWIAVALAAWVGMAALNNLWTWLPDSRWCLGIGAGLLQGFAVAGALTGAAAVLGLTAVLGAGLALLAALFVALAFALRTTRLYRQAMLPLGSVAILCAAVWWLGQRI